MEIKMQKVQLQIILVAFIVCGVFCGTVLFSPQVLAQDKPADVPDIPDVPEKVLKEMQAQFSLPKDLDSVAQRRILPPRMKKVMGLGQDAEKKYPNAKNLYQVRAIMLHAAGYLVSQKESGVTEKYYQDIARQILSSNAPVENKVSTEFILLSREAFTKKITEKELDNKLEVLLKKYKKTKGYPQAVCQAVILVSQKRYQNLADKYVKILKKDCPNDPFAQKLLKAIEETKAGKTFEAELKTLDGKTLSMPKDTMGKIVVVDFWASWCPPCRELMPHLIKFHTKFAPKGIVIIGISLDNNKTEMEKYIKDTGIPWVITYSGKGWGDPTVRKSGIDGIPSVWIIGKDGKVVSTDAAGREEQIVSTLLEADEKTDKE
jgi:thiol-disulfide isomerase/thioredoxin